VREPGGGVDGLRRGHRGSTARLVAPSTAKPRNQASQTDQKSSHRTHIHLVSQPVNVDGVTIDRAYMPQDRVFCTYARAVEAYEDAA
jgi:hypothetical protein